MLPFHFIFCQVGTDSVEAQVADLEVLPMSGVSTEEITVPGKDRTGCLQSLISGVTAEGGECFIVHYFNLGL